jgi:hypothetical protein
MVAVQQQAMPFIRRVKIGSESNKEQRTLIQKVSAQLEMSTAAPQTVLNNQ